MSSDPSDDSGVALPTFGSTLQEAITKKFGTQSTVKPGKNFNTKGWNFSGKTAFPCTKCGNPLESFRCRYESSKKARPYHWSLYCNACETVVGPSKLDPDQREVLYSTISPVVSKRNSTEVVKTDRNADKSALDSIYEILGIMRAANPQLCEKSSFELIEKISAVMNDKNPNMK